MLHKVIDDRFDELLQLLEVPFSVNSVIYLIESDCISSFPFDIHDTNRDKCLSGYDRDIHNSVKSCLQTDRHADSHAARD